jgi:hypothetical protein
MGLYIFDLAEIIEDFCSLGLQLPKMLLEPEARLDKPVAAYLCRHYKTLFNVSVGSELVMESET